MGVFDQLDYLLDTNVQTETERICDMPKVWTHTNARSDLPNVMRPEFPGQWELRDLQVEALYIIYKMQGLLGALDVGEGKTLVDVLAGTVLNASKIVVLLPKALETEFWIEYDKYTKHFNVPSRSRIYLVPYSMLSSRTNHDILHRIGPDLVIADEAQHLMNKNSARTRRFIAFMEANTQTRFVAMTGTLFRNSILDVQHLSKYALRHNSPIPLDTDHLNIWSNCLDLKQDKGVFDYSLKSGPDEREFEVMSQLQKTMGLPISPKFDDMRHAFYQRFASTEGVVVTDKPTPLPELRLHRINDLAVPLSVRQAFQHIKDTGETPSGEEVIVDADQYAAIEKRLSCGFFYKYDWAAIGGYDEDWLMRKKQKDRAIRLELETNAAPGYDTPLFIINKIIRDLEQNPALVSTSGLHWAWDYWAQVKHKPVPPRVPVWLDDFFIADVVDRACALGEPVLAWGMSRALLGRVADLADLPLYGAGSSIPASSRGKYSAVLSIGVHKTGVNLPDWHYAIIMEPPSCPIIWQQMLGREHRTGQQHTVDNWVYTHTKQFAHCVDHAITGAEWREVMEGRQKLIHATWGGNVNDR